MDSIFSDQRLGLNIFRQEIYILLLNINLNLGLKLNQNSNFKLNRAGFLGDFDCDPSLSEWVCWGSSDVVFFNFRNEKCLASIAAGNWVLHKSYLEASRKAGHFVDEEPHEWGVEIPGEPLSNLAIAARRWRMELRKV